ncbi:alkaline phosphatase [Wenyingzhuangia marina]|uniref:Alkaline phosphatase n=1 Tax=Wenyingzhuangia marina TaxID=1195760 RepID=A0A1M5SZR4_9FLAO|nr:alkaline phosphatase [Wenyingzhuangia marina]GGF64704.1 alkaline phosphatase [Wenyingzhuangia marina]SHH43643.1 alkaline phosphatase [Wenyingzhuangia marina]
MNKIIKSASAFLGILVLASCSKNQEPKKTSEEPLNIIFMVGDGMGVPQVSSAFYFGEEIPNFKQFKSIGLSRTSSVSHLITDSAAGATAFSTGEKTYKRAIGVSKDTISLPTILEQLQAKGYQTGLACLTSLTHATPAAFYAHVKDRDMHEEIADYLVNAHVDFLAGGGKKFLSKRKDGRNLFDTLIKQNYKLDTLALSEIDPTRPNAFFLTENELPNKIQGRKDFLPEATKKGLDYFSANKKPFFFMVEGSFIDWGGHAKDDKMMIEEVLDFDKTIGVVLDFVKTHPNTLLVVTADHETGGVSIGKFYEEDAQGNKKEVPNKVQVYFNTDQHSTELVPVFAKGKGEELFRGIYENNEIYHKLIKAIGN